MTKHDPFGGMAVNRGEAAAARKQLELLAQQDREPRLREMARDILAGKVDLRGAVLGEKYRDALNESVASFSAWYRGLSDEEKAEQRGLAEEYMEEARREEAQPRRRARVEEDEWEEPESIYRRDPPRC